MIDHEPTVRGRYVGRELLRAAQKSGRNAAEMAELLGWSPSKVSRLLSGKRLTSTEDVSAFLALCGVTGTRRAELLALAARGYEPLWWQEHGTRPPVRNQALVDNEERAVRITSFGDTLVPDLLQAPDYSRALLAAQQTIPDGEIEERIAETQRRQRILDCEFGAPQLQVFLAEYALTRTGAGDAVMSDQVHHLLRLAVRPEFAIRVVPDECGACDITPFSLMEFPEYQPAVYLDHTTWTAFLERPETIDAYRSVIIDFSQRALDEASSRARLAEIATRRAHRSQATASPVISAGTAPAQATAIWEL